MSDAPDFTGYNHIKSAHTGRGVPKSVGEALEDGDYSPRPKPPPADLEFVNPTSLDGLIVPPRQWLVIDWVPMARATSIYGGGGEGKTLLAQMLATACAIGQPWIGLPVRKAKSLLLFAEDDLDEMHRRQDDINRHYGCGFADLDAMRWLPRLGDDNVLMNWEDGFPIHTSLFDQLLNAAKEHDAKLIVTDTLADVFSGDENNRGQARAFAQQTLGLLARETQGAVIALAHPSRAGMNSGSGESGSTAWLGTFRSQLYLSTPNIEEGGPPDHNMRVLTRKKSNAARRDEAIELRWSNGVFIPVHVPTSGFVGSIERRVAERVFLELLDRMAAEGRHVSESNRAANYAPKIFAARPDREGYREADFRRAMENLFARKELVMTTYRSASRNQRECIGRAQTLSETPDAAGCITVHPVPAK
jgi:RecA-family ATPase